MVMKSSATFVVVAVMVKFYCQNAVNVAPPTTTTMLLVSFPQEILSSVNSLNSCIHGQIFTVKIKRIGKAVDANNLHPGTATITGHGAFKLWHPCKFVLGLRNNFVNVCVFMWSLLNIHCLLHLLPNLLSPIKKKKKFNVRNLSWMCVIIRVFHVHR